MCFSSLRPAVDTHDNTIEVDVSVRVIDPAEARANLKPRMRIVRDMLLGGSYTAQAVADRINAMLGTNTGTAAATARIRDLRKPQYGGYTIEAQKLDGIYFYSLVA